MSQMPNEAKPRKSTVSGQTEPSKTPAKLLALGKLLVQELQLEAGGDTLGRWMAHHIAELIQGAEAEVDPAERSRKEEKAAEAITRLWSHRSKYENRINPAWELRPILQVLRTLDPEQNVWISYPGAHGREGLRHLYDIFRRLIIVLLVRRVPADKIKAAVDSAGVTAAFQDEDEREVVTSIDHWLTEAQRKSVSGEAPNQSDDEEKKSLEDIGRELIAEARKTLDLIQDELGKPVEQPHPTRRRRKSR